MNELINRLVDARADVEQANLHLEGLRQQHPEIFAAIDALEGAKKTASLLEREVRDEGNARLMFGEGVPDVLGVKPGMKATYDKGDAVMWAIEHKLPSLLTLNSDLFEVVALKAPDILGEVVKYDDGDYDVEDRLLCVAVRQMKSVVVPKTLQRVEVEAAPEPVPSAALDEVCPF